MADGAGTSAAAAAAGLHEVPALADGEGSRKCKRFVSFVPKGGAGKTTTTVNLAAALVQKGRTVVVIDADAQCNLTTHLKREPDEPEEGPPKRTSARPPKRRRREEDGSGEDEGAEPPEQEAAGEPAGIFPASLKDKLGNFDTLPKKMPDLKGSHPTVYNYISSFISGDDVDAVELVAVELPGLGPGRMFLLPGAPEVSELEWDLNSITPTMSDAPVKQACWFRLLKAIEDKYDPDYIFIDLNPAPSKFNCLAMLSCDFIIASVGAALYDISSCAFFLKEVIAKMYQYGQVNILTVQKEHEKKNPATAAQRKAQGKWFPRREKDRTTLPRLPKILPFFMQRYKVRAGNLTAPPTQWVKTLQSVVLDACNRLNSDGGSGDKAHPNYQLRQMIFTNQASQGGPIKTLDQAASMVYPLVSNLEAVIAMSHHSRKPIVCITSEEAKKFASTSRGDKQSKVKLLEYAKTKFGGLADSLERLDIKPDFYYG